MLRHDVEPWPFLPELCPCDPQFMAWLAREGVRNEAIFHFGTGLHHFVGLANADAGAPNAVLAITASKGEHDAYMDLVVARPDLAWTYKVLFGNIYQLDPRLLPEFGVVTLFHLCEYREAADEAAGALTDLDVALTLIDRLKPGGRVLFYAGSDGYGAAAPLITEAVAAKGLEPEPDFERLRVYRRPS